MRIIAGEFKNRTIKTPRGKSIGTITEMVRESLFNILGDHVVDARFGDLYAGSGVVGIEALSRGAKRVTLIDKERKNAQLIKSNLSELDISKERARVWHNDVFQIADSESEWAEWDIAFLDPPHVVKENFLDALINVGVVQPGQLIIIKRPSEGQPILKSDYLSLLDQRNYGKADLYFFS